MKWFVSSLVIILLVGCGKMADSNTHYSRPDLAIVFASVVPGDSLETVYKKIGSPLWIELVQNVGDPIRAVQRQTFAGDLASATALTETNSTFCLTYSQPSAIGKTYLLYYIDIEDRRVVRTAGPLYMD